MNFRKLKSIALLLFGFGITGLHAQQTIPATGGEALGNGGSVSYTVGQVVYTTNNGTNGSLAQGIQQPYEIFVITSISEAEGINLAVSAFPNPTSDYLTLHVENYDFTGLRFRLYDLTGKLLEDKKIEGSLTRITMSNLVSAAYLLKVIQSDKEVKTFKIIKN